MINKLYNHIDLQGVEQIPRFAGMTSRLGLGRKEAEAPETKDYSVVKIEFNKSYPFCTTPISSKSVFGSFAIFGLAYGFKPYVRWLSTFHFHNPNDQCVNQSY